MKFRDIKKFVPNANYAVDISWSFLPTHLAQYIKEYGLDMSPDFQRGHVWTVNQKISYVEYILQGGMSGKDIFLNCPGWGSYINVLKNFVLVDGKQRLEAVLGFLSDEFGIFGGVKYSEFTDKPDITTASFKFHINELETRDEVLSWYLCYNSGGTPHTNEEIERVRALLGTEVQESDGNESIIKKRVMMNKFAEIAQEDEERKKQLEARLAEEAAKPKKKGKR